MSRYSMKDRGLFPVTRPRNRYRRGYDDVTWKERWVVFKHNRRKPGWIELLAYGLFLNIVGACLLLIKAQLDKDIIEAAVDKRFQEAGIPLNGAEGREPLLAPNSVIMVMITMAGRMANVVGTMKIYKAIGKVLTARKRRKFQKTTERIQNGETEAECTELLADVCQIF